MNILVINGSPKDERSNTLKLTNAFLAGYREADEKQSLNVETLSVAKLKINPCLGCFACWKNTPGKCCINDDMQMVIEKMLWADITIWSFPLYYYSLPSQLKALMDRQLPLTLPFMRSDTKSGGHPSRYDMSEKKTVLISTCGFYTAESNYESITAQFDKLCGKQNYTTLFYGQGELFQVPELSKRTEAALSVVRQAGKEYSNGSISEETNTKLKELLFPRDVFERMADASWGISSTGEKEDISLIFTKQMAALYNPAAYKGTDIIFDIDYTDIGKCYRIILKEKESCVLESFIGKPTTIIHTPFSVWKSIAAGEISGSEALMKQLYFIEGDFDLLLKWDEYFGKQQGTDTVKNTPVTNAKTDMRYVLTPWIVFWTAVNFHAFWGAMISLLVCAVLPLLFYKNKRTVYDVVSCSSVSLLSMLLINSSIAVVLPLSYLIFGMMWSISACLKIPLSAEYSMNDYGGDKALRNPLFIKTNRILTTAWGLFYLIAAIGSYFIIRSNSTAALWIISSICPLLLGIFTLWFQKWYPYKIARGNNK